MSLNSICCRRALGPSSRLLQTRPFTAATTSASVSAATRRRRGGAAAAAAAPGHPITMPLKARITNPAFSTTSAAMASQNLSQEEIQALSYPKDEPGDDPEDVLFGNLYGARTIELNRPKKLNSLNGSMARKIMRRMKEWEKSQMANVVIMSGAGPKAFCAGGDVAALALGIREGGDRDGSGYGNGNAGVRAAADYFRLEYRLDHAIASYSKPYVAYMDGITMGGGVGLSVHAPVRIATERTVFAMPETTIGFFPDVGASFFLPRMDGHVGTYLALTSDRLKGADVYHAGIATHYIESSSLPLLTQRLAELQFKDYLTLDERLRAVDATVAEYTTGLPRDAGPALLSGALRRAVDRCFAPLAVDDILAKLEAEAASDQNSDAIRTWAERTRQTILERSPLSVRVTRRMLHLGLGWDIRQAFVREAALAANFMRSADFSEGVAARLIDKPARKPAWQPAALADVTDAHVDGMLARHPHDAELQLLPPGVSGGGGGGADAFTEYPHAWLGLPSEREIRAMVERERFASFGQVMDAAVAARRGKHGVADKVKDILQRCASQQSGAVEWTAPALGLDAAHKLEYSSRTA